MIETIVNITTGACYLVTAGVIVKYIYSRFVQHKNHQGTNIPMVKKTDHSCSCRESIAI